MPRIAELEARVTADTRDAEQGLDRVQAKAQSFISGLARIGANALSFAAGMAGLQGLQAGFRALSDSVIGFNARMEQSEMAWGTLLGSAEAAKAMIADLKRFAIDTPFDFPGIEEASRNLLAMGFAAHDIIPMMADIGDAAAALGQGSEGVSRIVRALGQMHSAGRLNAQDMNQLVSLGVPAWQLLADSIGVTVAEARKMSEQGKITGDQMVSAFREFVQENWGGMMAAQAQTFNGAIGTIQDSLEQLGAQAFKPLFDRTSQTAQAFAALASDGSLARFAASTATALDKIIGLFERIPAPVVETIAVFAGVVAGLMALTAVIGGVGPAIAAAGTAIATIAGTIGAPILVLAAVIAGLYLAWRTNFLGMRDIIDSVFRWIGDALTWLVGWFANFGPNVSALWNRLWLEIRAFTGRAVSDILGFVIDFGNKVYDVMAKVFELVGRSDIIESWRVNFNNLFGGIQDTVDAWGEEARAAKEGLAWTTGGELERGREVLSDIGATLRDFVTPAVDENAASLDLEGQAALGAAAGMESLGNAAKDAQRDVGNLVQSLVRIHPATLAASVAVRQWEIAVESVNSAIDQNDRALERAQEKLDRMRDRLSQLNDQLGEARNRLQELSNPRLIGMGDFDMKLNAIRAQLDRIKLAESLGVPLEEIIAQYPLLTAGAEEYLATLPTTTDELRELLEQLELMRRLSYDEKLRLLQEAAEPTAPEISYEEALSGISQTLVQIDRLNIEIAKQERAIAKQERAIASLEKAGRALNETLRHYQAELQNAKAHQDAINQALELAYKWFLEDRQKMVEMGGEGVAQAQRVDAAARALLTGVNNFAGETTETATTTLEGLIEEFQLSSATAVAAVNANLLTIPTDIYTTHHIRTVYDDAAPAPSLPGRAAGGPVQAGLPYIVGERGPEVFVPKTSGYIVPNGYGSGPMAISRSGDVYVTVQGSVITVRKLAEEVREELLKVKQRNGTTGL